MTVLKVNDIHCGNCVARIEKALSAAKLKFSVSLSEKTVTIDGGDADIKTAISELDDLGFEAVKMA